MDVSVVIPVYNAALFLEEAVTSALKQDEVREILLVEDGSTDTSLQLCKQLADRFPQTIILCQHPDGGNHGASSARNLGMLSVSCGYIAFLDADDIYTEDRFKETIQIFQKYRDADGVYEAVGMLHEDHGLSEDITRHAGIGLAHVECSDPGKLASVLANTKSGYIHLNGLTIRRPKPDAMLFFDPSLRQCQDTDFVLRLASVKRLYGGPSERIVALRRVHDANRVFNITETRRYRYQCMRKCALHGFYGMQETAARWSILNRMARASRLAALARRSKLPVTPFRLLVIMGFLITNPRVIAGLLWRKHSNR